MTAMIGRWPWRSSRSGTRPVDLVVPPDPGSLGVALDPRLQALRAGLLAHRRRLWLRRAVRRALYALALGTLVELALAVAMRLEPLEAGPQLAAAVPVACTVALLLLVVRVRPTLGETALALDAEGGTDDAVASALAFAPSAPGPGPSSMEDGPPIAVGDAFDLGDARVRFIRRQRGDALARLRAVDPGLFRPRLAVRPVLVTLAAAALLVPVTLLPNPQDAVIAQRRQIGDEAQRQAERIDRVAADLETKGADVNDPRTRLADELHQLAAQLRADPTDLDLNLAKLGSVEDTVRSQLDPANEQRAASLASLARSLSRAATGDPQANAGGDPKEAKSNLQDLADRLDTMTRDQQQALARDLTALQGQASQADGSAGQALQDAAASLAQGDAAGARTALDRLGQALDAASSRVQVNRDLAGAASSLQDARRSLADAGGHPGQLTAGQTGQQGQGGQGGQGPSPGPGQSPGASGGASGQPGQSAGSGQGQGGQSGQGGQVARAVKVARAVRVARAEWPGRSKWPGRSGAERRRWLARWRWLERGLPRQRHLRRPRGRTVEPQPPLSAGRRHQLRVCALRPPGQAR